MITKFKIYENNNEGKYIELIYMDDKYTKLKSGDVGIVDHVDGIGQIHVKWGNGSSLALVPEIDEFRYLTDAEVAAKKFNL